MNKHTGKKEGIIWMKRQEQIYSGLWINNARTLVNRLAFIF
jgi:hypothetical protein